MTQLNSASSGQSFVAASSSTGYWTNQTSSSSSTNGLQTFTSLVNLGSALTNFNSPSIEIRLAHGLGTKPLTTSWKFKCLANDLDYSVGDEIDFDYIAQLNNFGGGNHYSGSGDDSSYMWKYWWNDNYYDIHLQMPWKYATNAFSNAGSAYCNPNNWGVVASAIAQQTNGLCGAEIRWTAGVWYMDNLAKSLGSTANMTMDLRPLNGQAGTVFLDYATPGTSYSVRSYCQTMCTGTTLVMKNISGDYVTLLTNAQSSGEIGIVPNIATGSASATNWTITLTYNGTNWNGTGFTSP